MKLSIKKGTTSKLIQFLIQDSTKLDGGGLTGLVHDSSSLTAYYYREGAGSAVAIALKTMTLGTWTTEGFVAVDGTNMPGLYQLGIPDLALASGANSVTIMLKGATNMVPVVIEIELTATDNQDSVRAGMTALPNAAAGANTGLPVVGTQVPNATAGANNGLPTVGAQVPNATAGAASGLAIVGSAMALGTDALSAAAVSSAGAAKLMDIMARRATGAIEGSANGDALVFNSLYGLMARFVHHHVVAGSELSVKKSDDSALATVGLVFDLGAAPIIEVVP